MADDLLAEAKRLLADVVIPACSASWSPPSPQFNGWFATAEQVEKYVLEFPNAYQIYALDIRADVLTDGGVLTVALSPKLRMAEGKGPEQDYKFASVSIRQDDPIWQRQNGPAVWLRERIGEIHTEFFDYFTMQSWH